MRASAIYEGSVIHRRLAVAAHEFRYRLAMAYIDLDELPGLMGGALLDGRLRPLRFDRRDYFGAEAVPLADAVRDRVDEQTGVRPQGPIRLLTQLRSFGHCFNPISLYYCFESDGAGLQAVLAEVTNTPWGERHAYVLAPAAGPAEPARGRLGAIAGTVEKALHVSPFMGMDQSYEWRLTPPGQRLAVSFASRQEGRIVFEAHLAMDRAELSATALRRMAARYPAATVRVLALIYLQAARLRCKGVSVHPHPGSRRCPGSRPRGRTERAR